jgi:hypothetical protein
MNGAPIMVGSRTERIQSQNNFGSARLRYIAICREMGIPFTDLSGRVRTSSADDRVIWRRSHSDRLLGEPVEEQAAGL